MPLNTPDIHYPSLGNAVRVSPSVETPYFGLVDSGTTAPRTSAGLALLLLVLFYMSAHMIKPPLPHPGQPPATKPDQGKPAHDPGTPPVRPKNPAIDPKVDPDLPEKPRPPLSDPESPHG
ncbi:MAG TPA: hypothetical protein VHD83_27615 [Puia sp.]|nr:hypothetical protein [Puia sp.]